MQAGWASVDITPEIPCRMGGYAARTAPADAVHDPLFARALALGTRSAPLILVVCDLVSVDEELVHEVRRQVAAGLPGASVWLCATHTHSGPDVGRLLAAREPDPRVIRRVTSGAARAAREAVDHLRPVRAAWASGPIEGVATNRDHPGSGEDVRLDVLCLFADGDGPPTPSAVFGSFPCHPTVMGPGNLAISADLPGAVRRQVRERVGQGTWVTLATGAAGDISTRHVRQGQGFEEVERLGRLLAEQAQALISTARPLALGTPVIREAEVPLQRKALPDAEALEAAETAIERQRAAALQAGDAATARTLETTLQGIHAATQLAQVEAAMPGRATIAAATLGDLGVAAIPGELYNRLGQDIRHGVKPAVLLLGYANGYIGYIPTQEAYQSLDYEVLTSPFAPGTGERIRSAAIGLLGDAGTNR